MSYSTVESWIWTKEQNLNYSKTHETWKKYVRKLMTRVSIWSVNNPHWSLDVMFNLVDEFYMNVCLLYCEWACRRHQMKIFSALLVLCQGNSPVMCEFSSHRPVTRSFEVFFFNVHLNKRLSKQSRGWWFETPLRSLWRHCNGHSIVVCPAFFITGNSTKHGLSKGTSSSFLPVHVIHGKWRYDQYGRCKWHHEGMHIH